LRKYFLIDAAQKKLETKVGRHSLTMHLNDPKLCWHHIFHGVTYENEDDDQEYKPVRATAQSIS
jgi:hypothetical protein